MNFVIRHTEYLLSRNDCVIIPGIGAILAHYNSARYDSDMHVMLPPRRLFTFNGMLKHNDGLLACSLSRTEGISIDAASDRIAQAIEAMNRLLHETGELPLGKIGVLSIDSETAAVRFTPSEPNTICSTTAFLPEIVEQNAASVEENLAKEATLPIIKPYSHATRAWRIAACSIGLAALCFVASTPISVEDAALASFSPEITHVSTQELKATEAEQIPTIQIFASHRPDACIDIEALPSMWFASESSLKTQGLNYLVIIGSFASSSEAMKFINSRASENLKFVEKDGRFRVFAAAYENEIDAYRDINANLYAETGAWVCRI